MQSSYWGRQRLTSGTKTAESKPLKLTWMSQEKRSAANTTARLLQRGLWKFPRGTQARLWITLWAVKDRTCTDRTPAKQDRSPVPGLTREQKMEGVVLKHSPAPSEELYLMTEPKESAAASRRSSHGLNLKDLDKLTRYIGKFNPSVPNSQNVQAYLQDIEFHLEMRPNVMDKDKLYLLRTTSSPEVRSFLDRQPANTKTDYQLLQKALIKNFADPESDQGLVAALETRQGRHEFPQTYYSRLRQAYFGTRNESDMEDELNIKTLFLRNLHPGISHHLGVLACPRTMNTQQLRDLVQNKRWPQKRASKPQQFLTSTLKVTDWL